VNILCEGLNNNTIKIKHFKTSTTSWFSIIIIITYLFNAWDTLQDQQSLFFYDNSQLIHSPNLYVGDDVKQLSFESTQGILFSVSFPLVHAPLT